MTYELLKAVISGNQHKVHDLLEGVHDPRSSSSYSQTHPHINQPDGSGHTALMHAVEGGNPNLVHLLLKKGANPHIKDKKLKFTALIKAIANGNKHITELLISEPSIKNSPWIMTSALSHACREGQSEIVDLLLSYHIPNLPEEGFLPIMWAREAVAPRIVKTLNDHYGNESWLRQENRELNAYLERCWKIKRFGNIFGIKAKIKVKYPNSKNSEHISTEGKLTLESIQLLNHMLSRVCAQKTLHEKTRTYFQKIYSAFQNVEAYLGADDAFKAHDFNKVIERGELVILPAGCYQYNMFIAVYKGWLLLADPLRKISGDAIKIYQVNADVTLDYILNIRSNKSKMSLDNLANWIFKIVGHQQPIFTVPVRAKKSHVSNFGCAKFSIKCLLYFLRLIDLKEALESNYEKDRLVLYEMGINSLQDAKLAAFGYAKREYQLFCTEYNDHTLDELIAEYQHPNTLSEDKKICRDLLIEVLSKLLHDTNKKEDKDKMANSEIHSPFTQYKIKHALKKVKLIICALDEFDRHEAVETLKNEGIDILGAFIKIHDYDMLELLLKAGASIGLTLRLAAENNDLNVIQHLANFDLSQRINEANDEGDTALLIAAKLGHYDIVKFLLEHGANPSQANRKTKRTAFDICEGRSDTYMFRLLERWNTSFHADTTSQASSNTTSQETYSQSQTHQATILALR